MAEHWVEHFEWLEPLFNERLDISGGKMHLPTRPGLGFSLSEQARTWTADSAVLGPHGRPTGDRSNVGRIS